MEALQVLPKTPCMDGCVGGRARYPIQNLLAWINNLGLQRRLCSLSHGSVGMSCQQQIRVWFPVPRQSHSECNIIYLRTRLKCKENGQAMVNWQWELLSPPKTLLIKGGWGQLFFSSSDQFCHIYLHFAITVSLDRFFPSFGILLKSLPGFF